MGGKKPRSVGKNGDLYAALDLGTNNCRLLIARRGGAGAGGFEVVEAFSRIVRLGEGLASGGTLGEVPMARTLKALGSCAARIARRGVARGRYVATEACRRATNCDVFLRRVKVETGLDLEIISAAEEAALALAGCRQLLDPAMPRAVVFDIGGGSSEIIWIDSAASGGPRVIDFVSLPLGVVNLSEAHGGTGCSPAGFTAMVETVRPYLAAFEARHNIAAEIAGGRVQMLGTSGTATTLAGVHLGLPRYQRQKIDGLCMTIADLGKTMDAICRMDLPSRAAHPCIGPRRADLIVAGCAILDAIFRQWPISSLRVADRGVRDGLLQGMIAS